LLKFWKQKPKIEKDLIPIISQKAMDSKKSIDVIVDEILRRHLIEGPIYRCSVCGSANTALFKEEHGIYKGGCGNCRNFVPLYKT